MSRLASLSAPAKRHLVRASVKQSQGFSTSSRTCSYADTLQNLKIGAHTRVLFQGFTGESVSQYLRSYIDNEFR